MRAEDHVIAWIESSRPHYDRLLDIEKARKGAAGYITSVGAIRRAATLVADAYCDMIRDGDALKSDPYSPADLAKAVALVVAWELEA